MDRVPGLGQPNVTPLDWLPATVPGHVQLDLMKQGILPDVFRRRFEFGSQWVDAVGWSYRVHFEWADRLDAPRQVLRFEGLDTIATVWLNGAKLAAHDNMHVPLEVDVSNRLLTGANELRIDFEPAATVGMARRNAYFKNEGLDAATDNFDERAFVRKAGYMYGWDWGPRFVSCGVWQPVKLLEFAGRFTSLQWRQQALEDGSFWVVPEAVIEGDGEVTFTLNGETKRAGEEFMIEPELWWPNGYGAQPLYEAIAELSTGEKLIKHLGFRTIELKREKDSQGESFQFIVNGLPIHARGANWIPNDSFPSRVNESDYNSQVAQCRDLNMNMLRVWGGGLYESEDFYDACDRYGILVWQDFAFACSYYPDDEAMQAAVELEARCQVHRLRDRASLALWCGNNENLTMWEGKWGKVSPSRCYGEKLYNGTLPAVVAELDSHRPYIASSPIGGEDANSDDIGDQHFWEVWHGMGDWCHYRDSRARFCSEFGFASACLPALWFKTLEDYTLGGEEHLSHDKTNKPWEQFKSYVELHYPEASTLGEWTYTSQLNQRDAVRFGIEHYRRDPGCKGALVWQFNDCWPVQSWALQDYDRKLKVAGWEMARLCAPMLLSVVCTETEAEIWVINDSAASAEQTVSASWVSTRTGEALGSEEYSVTTEQGERKLVGSVDFTGSHPNTTALCVEIKGMPETKRWSLQGEPKDTELTAVDIRVVAPGEYLVTGFVRDLIAWQVDRWLVAEPVPGLAITACNEAIKFKLETDEPVQLRSLAGDHKLVRS